MTASTRSGLATIAVAGVVGALAALGWKTGLAFAALVVVGAFLVVLAHRPEFALYAYIAAIPLQKSPDLPVVGTKLTVAEPLLALGLGLLILRALASKRGVKLTRVPYQGPIGLLLIATLLSALSVPNVKEVWIAYLVEAGTLFSLAVMYVVMVYHLRSSPKALGNVLAALVLGLLISEVAGVVGSYDLLRGQGPSSAFVYEGFRVIGTFRNPNALASFYMAGLFIVAGLWLSPPGLTPWPRWSLVGCFLVGCLVLVATGSRGGYVGFTAGIGMLSLLARRFRGRLSVLMFLLVLSSATAIAFTLTEAVTSVSYLASALKAFTSLASDLELQGRFTIWGEVWPVITAHPVVGAGAGTLRFVTETQLGIEGGFEAHNTPLGITAETGAIGLAALLWLAVAVTRDMARAIHVSRGTARQGLVAGLVAATIAIGVDSLSQNIQRHRQLWLLLALNAVMATASVARSNPDVDPVRVR
jgi:O-antigen ligase